MPIIQGRNAVGTRIVQVDAFTDRPFSGNPAAVCILAQPADEGWMRNVAREMNLSETAFLHPDGGAYRLRWFTPTVEVDLWRSRHSCQRARALGGWARAAR